MKGSLSAARQAQTLNAVVATLSQCLDLDSGTLILELKQAEETRYTNTAAPAGLGEKCLGENPVEEMDEDEAQKLKKNERAARADNDFSDLLPVSCCSKLNPRNAHKYTHTGMLESNEKVSLYSLNRDMYEYF